VPGAHVEDNHSGANAELGVATAAGTGRSAASVVTAILYDNADGSSDNADGSSAASLRPLADDEARL
jgi:hypothetical protein